MKDSGIIIRKENIDFFIEQKKSSSATISLLLPGGMFFEPKNLQEISHVAEHYITSSPNTNIKDWLNNYYYKYKIKANAQTWKDHVSIALTSPSEFFRPALDLIFQNWLGENISETNFQRAKSSVLSEIRQYCDNPFHQSIDKFNNENAYQKKVYTPYPEREESCRKLELQNLQDYLDWTANNPLVKIAITGNVSIEKITDYIDKLKIEERKNNNFHPISFDYKEIHKETSSAIKIVRNDALKANYVVIGLYFNKDLDSENSSLLNLVQKAFDIWVSQFAFNTKFSYKYETGIEKVPYNNWIKCYLQINPEQTNAFLKEFRKELNKFPEDERLFKIAHSHWLNSYIYPNNELRAQELSAKAFYGVEQLTNNQEHEMISQISFQKYQEFLTTLIQNIRICMYGKVNETEGEINKILRKLS